MFADKLGIGAPQDITARMLLTNSAGEIVYDKNGEPGWIEFYGPEAEPVRRFRRQIEREQYIKAQKDKRKGNKLPTEAEADREIDELEALTVDAISTRVKAWRLVNTHGEVLEDVATMENCRALFGHPSYAYLRRAATDFLSEPDNFFLKKPAN